MRVDRIARLAALAALPLALSACDWFTTFRYQPSLHTWENMTIAKDTAVKLFWPRTTTWSRRTLLGPSYADEDTTMLHFRGNPQYSVPITGTALAYFQVSNMALPGVIDSVGAAVINPIAPTDSSLAIGRRYFQVNCAVCHGDDGTGTKNPIIAKYGLAFSIMTDVTKSRPDGYIFGMIRNGRGLMPSYNRIEEEERWHVVNYVRGLQGKLGKEVAKGPLGYPGQTGSALPGSTETAPTHPAPFWKPGTGATGIDQRGPMGDQSAPVAAKKGGAR